MIFSFFVYAIGIPFLFDNIITPHTHLEEVGVYSDGPVRIYDEQLDVVTTARSAAVLDARTGELLYAKNVDASLPIASITKLLTAQVLLNENLLLDTKITIETGDRVGGSSQKFFAGERITIRDLLHAALIVSDNDAAQLLQRVSGMDEHAFVNAMNSYAHELGLRDAYFVEPTGLSAQNRATVFDVMLLLKSALEHEDLSEILQKEGHTLTLESDGGERNLEIYNTNWLLGTDFDTIGGKTGYITESGYCLVSKVKTENGHPLFVAVLGSDSIDNRFQDTKSLISWVEQHYTW